MKRGMMQGEAKGERERDNGEEGESDGGGSSFKGRVVTESRLDEGERVVEGGRSEEPGLRNRSGFGRSGLLRRGIRRQGRNGAKQGITEKERERKIKRG